MKEIKEFRKIVIKEVSFDNVGTDEKSIAQIVIDHEQHIVSVRTLVGPKVCHTPLMEFLAYDRDMRREFQFAKCFNANVRKLETREADTQTDDWVEHYVLKAMFPFADEFGCDADKVVAEKLSYLNWEFGTVIAHYAYEEYGGATDDFCMFVPDLLLLFEDEHHNFRSYDDSLYRDKNGWWNHQFKPLNVPRSANKKHRHFKYLPTYYECQERLYKGLPWSWKSDTEDLYSMSIIPYYAKANPNKNIWGIDIESKRLFDR